jgi:hypothetical protein
MLAKVEIKSAKQPRLSLLFGLLVHDSGAASLVHVARPDGSNLKNQGTYQTVGVGRVVPRLAEGFID